MKLNISQLLLNGIAAHKEGKLEEAKKLYNSILEVEPNHLDANNNLGVALNRLGKLDEAEICFKKVINLNPNMAEAHNNLGRILLEINKLSEAEASFIKAATLKPDYLSAYYNLGVTLIKLQKFQKAEAILKKALELKPDHLNAQYSLGVVLHNLNKLDEAIICFKKTLEMKLDHFEAQYSLGISLLATGKLDNAEASFKEVLKIKPDSFDAHNALGNIYLELGRLEEAKASLRKALKINPNYDLALYNLGLTLFTLKEYKSAAKEFGLTNYNNSEEFLLKCFFELNEQSNFYKHLDYLINKNKNNALIGSLVSRAHIRYGVDKINPFCNEPLNYVLKTVLLAICDFKNTFAKNTKDILNDNNIRKKYQTLLTKGMQTSGNVFSQMKDSTEEIKKIIYSEIEKYRIHFKGSNEGFLKNWPKDYYINGWIVSMKSGGNLSPHMHELGWLSGSVYINVPPKVKQDSGNLVVCIDTEISKKHKNSQKSIDVVTGSLCLFPSSLLHYTVPFESDEERIVLAFDVMSK